MEPRPGAGRERDGEGRGHVVGKRLSEEGGVLAEAGSWLEAQPQSSGPRLERPNVLGIQQALVIDNRTERTPKAPGPEG